MQRILSSMQEDPSGDKSAQKPFPGHFNENTMDITNIVEKVALRVEKECSASHTSCTKSVTFLNGDSVVAVFQKEPTVVAEM